MAVSVLSSFGHRFVGTDSDEDDQCLVCGALYRLAETPDGITTHRYATADGSDPDECTDDTEMCHGYPGEVIHWVGNDLCDGCEHCEHECPCLSCNS